MADRTFTHALVRAPGSNFHAALRTSGATLHVALAQMEHLDYCQRLARAGLTVEELPVENRYADGCFVQDTALVLGGRAIICRLAEPSRQGEEESVALAMRK